MTTTMTRTAREGNCVHHTITHLWQNTGKMLNIALLAGVQDLSRIRAKTNSTVPILDIALL
jgi:hypothetical protein